MGGCGIVIGAEQKKEGGARGGGWKSKMKRRTEQSREVGGEELWTGGGAGWKQKEADGGAGWGMRENHNNQKEEKWGVGRGTKLKEFRGERAEKGGRKSRRKGGFKLWQKERWENELQEKLEAIMDIFFFLWANCEEYSKSRQKRFLCHFYLTQLLFLKWTNISPNNKVNTLPGSSWNKMACSTFKETGIWLLLNDKLFVYRFAFISFLFLNWSNL